MFAKLIENPGLPASEQKEVLKAVITKNLKQNVHEVRLQFNHNYVAIKDVLVKHPKYGMRLALALHTWQIVTESLAGKRDNNAVDLLYAIIATNPTANGQYLLTEMSKTFQDNWRMLAILRLIAEAVVQHLEPKEYGWFLAVFVKLSATLIQGYLTIKNEPAQSSNDRIESDLQLINSCEQWITEAYVEVIQKLKGPTT
jgi:hypothetical protein